MERLYLVHGSESYQVHQLTNRWLTELAGAGMPAVEHVVQRSAGQDGATLLRVRLQPRTIVVGMTVVAGSRAGYWSERRSLLDMLKRSEGLILRLVNDETGESFDLDVVYEAGVEFDARSDIGQRGFQIAVQLKAYNPLWRSTEPRYIAVGIPTYADAGTFPAAFGWTLGSSLLYRDIAINYAGTWTSYPQIDIRGPITNPLINNRTTGEKLELQVSVPDNEVVRIDLTPGVKTVRNITTAQNWMQYLTSDSNLATFHLAAHPEAPNGINDLFIQGTLGGDNTAVTIRWYDRYIGI